MQKGFQIKGKTQIVDVADPDFSEMEKILLKITEGKYPFRSITKISIETAKQVLAPKYILYPETTESEQIESAKKAYRL